ncbi:helix-turn-helix transcriptional regulator [Levilactobacillus tangyuanensis]|uniref:Helix-turn-helix transcriptional regulator n=1 Tax=Levilactobacillus tangyuanensis TaxID=2486021 RepID=A0ABW1TN60_9LACO|nr:helix-turn-helix transcriptional regulator [Levilactobacillus tangyuanensis]
MTHSLGRALRQARHDAHLTQAATAEGICAQSMLSAIENGQYIPNSEILIQLCRRLQISLTAISLADNFAISDQVAINQELDRLCNQHAYRTLNDYLLSAPVLAAITTDHQTQAYYYYLGITEYQLNHDLDAAQRDFQLALSSAGGPVTTLTRLIHAANGLADATAGRPEAAKSAFKVAMHDLDQAPYEPDQNSLFYLAALADYQLDQLVAATARLQDGLRFITVHDSHYMLANCYHLLAVISAESDQQNQSAEATQFATMLTALFHEKVFDDFTKYQ